MMIKKLFAKYRSNMLVVTLLLMSTVVPVKLLIAQSAPKWFSTIKNTTWQTKLDNNTSVQLLIEDRRYFIYKGQNVLLDQGSVKFTTGNRIQLRNKNGIGYLKLSAISKAGFKAEGRVKLTLTDQNLSGQYTKHNKTFERPMPSSIYLAARYGDVGALKGFTRTKIPIDGDKNAPVSPLAYAVYYHHTAAVQLLLDRGANPNYVTKDKKSVLELAIESGHEEAMKLLIVKGADINKKTKNGESLISKALEFDSLEVIKMLVLKGAKIPKWDHHGHPALYHAMAKFALKGNQVTERLAFTKYIVEKAGYDPKTIDKHGRNILFYAANLGLADTVKYLRSKGVDAMVKDKQGKNVIDFIAGSEHKARVMPLLK